MNSQAATMQIRPDNLRFLREYIHRESGILLDETKGYLIETRLFSTRRAGYGLATDHQHFYLADDARIGANTPIYKVLDGKDVGSFRGPPCTIGGSSWDRPPLKWWNGKMFSPRSFALWRSELCSKATNMRLPWLNPTPFGLPVVPDV